MRGKAGWKKEEQKKREIELFKMSVLFTSCLQQPVSLYKMQRMK
jgi:hypothetical protein